MSVSKNWIAGALIALSSCAPCPCPAGMSTATQVPQPASVPAGPVALAQGFSFDVSPLTSLIGQVSFSWSTSGFATNPAPVAGSIFGAYMPLTQAQIATTGCSLVCMQTNHPDWIEYLSDEVTPAYYGSQTRQISNVSAGASNGTGGNLIRITVMGNLAGLSTGQTVVTYGIVSPAAANVINVPVNVIDTHDFDLQGTTFSGSYTASANDFADWGPDGTSIPLDFKNPAVQAYQLGFISAWIAAGYSSIDFDVAGPLSNGMAGHYTGTPSSSGACVGAPNACGMIWTKDFSGLRLDPLYAEASIHYACAMTRAIHAMTPSWGSPKIFTVGNVFDVGYATSGVNDLANTYEQEMEGCYDVAGNESTPFSYKTGSPVYLQESNYAVWLATAASVAARQGWWLVLYMGSTVAAPQPTPAQQAWAEAAYFLPKGPWSYLSAIGWPVDHGYLVTYDPSWFPPVGTPTGPYYVTGSGVYERSYTHGQIDANASATLNRTFNAPGPGWYDQFCNAITPGTNTLAPETAIIMVDAKPC